MPSADPKHTSKSIMVIIFFGVFTTAKYTETHEGKEIAN